MTLYAIAAILERVFFVQLPLTKYALQPINA